MEDTQSIIESNIDSYLNKKSTIDNIKLNQSTIDYHTQRLREKLHDDTIGAGMVVLALTKLGEGETYQIADYALRKGNNPGKVFVVICNKAIKTKP